MGMPLCETSDMDEELKMVRSKINLLGKELRESSSPSLVGSTTSRFVSRRLVRKVREGPFSQSFAASTLQALPFHLLHNQTAFVSPVYQASLVA